MASHIMDRGPRGVLLIAMVFTLFGACSKDPDSTPDPSEAPAPPPPVITTGDTTGLSVRYFGDTLMASPMGAVVLRTFDIDGDGDVDLRFKIRTELPLGVGLLALTSVQALHSGIHVSGLLVNDTTEALSGTVVTTGSGVPAPYAVLVATTITHDCGLGSGATIESISVDEPRIIHLDAGEVITDTDPFLSDSIPLRHHPHALMPSHLPSGDTLYTTQQVYPETCFSFPLDQEVYLGLKFEYMPGIVRLGWLRINHLYANGIVVMESAVEP